jgi:hypothetical protein
VSRLKADDAISELYIPVQDALRVHKLQARDLRTFQYPKVRQRPAPTKKAAAGSKGEGGRTS